MWFVNKSFSNNVDDSRLQNSVLYRAYAQELAKLHSIPYEALPKRKTYELNYVEAGLVDQWATMAHWNTMHVYVMDYISAHLHV